MTRNEKRPEDPGAVRPSMMRRLARVVLIAAVATAVGVFGWQFGPRKQSAEAKVFEQLLQFTKAMPPYLFEETAASRPHRIVVNNTLTYLTVGRTQDGIPAVLDFYSRHYPPSAAPRIEACDPDKIGNPKQRECAKVALAATECVRDGQAFRIANDDMGLLGLFEFRDAEKGPGAPRAGLLAEAMKTGELGRLGTFRIVIALRGEGAQTTILNLWTDKDLNVNNFIPGSSGDLPGRDIADVPRHPGDRRELSIAQENTGTVDRLALYNGEDSVADHVLFFRSRMPQTGWKSDDQVDSLLCQQPGACTLRYSRDGRECTLQIREDAKTGRVFTAVVERQNT